MTKNYKPGDHIPSVELSRRLSELSKAVTQGPEAVRREFTMRVPAELDRDADLVLSEASRRIMQLEAALRAMLALDKSFESVDINWLRGLAYGEDSTDMIRAVFKARCALGERPQPNA